MQRQFIHWQMTEFKKPGSKMRRSDLGGAKWFLPDRQPNGKPAPLPTAVIKHSKERAKRRVPTVDGRSQSSATGPLQMAGSRIIKANKWGLFLNLWQTTGVLFSTGLEDKRIQNLHFRTILQIEQLLGKHVYQAGEISIGAGKKGGLISHAKAT